MLGVGLTSQLRPVHVDTQPSLGQVASIPKGDFKPLRGGLKDLTGTFKGTPVSAVATDNEGAVWNFLIKRYSRNQTAGIMGNLAQEHHFRTDGDGIAQWTDGRKANLMARPNPRDINVQLQFLVEEMQGLSLPDTIEGATVTFQNQFERCGICMESQRIQYAYDVLAAH